MTRLTRAERDTKESRGSFLSPQYTYTIFGETERIFGYKGLSIDISLAADSLLTLLEVKYSERIPESSGVEVEDLDATISGYLPEDVFRSRTRWAETCNETEASFSPMGDNLESYEIDGVTFFIYKVSLENEGFAPFLERMQIFSILYIEGASLIDSTDSRFDVYTIYSKIEGRYEFVGYCTCYKYYFFDRHHHSFDFIRYRISQFVVLPNHQSKGHGGHLYDTIIESCRVDESILEVTVEDPSEAFDDLRDRRDLIRLTRERVFDDPEFSLPLSKDWVQTVRRQQKLAPRQFARLVEMNLLERLDKRDKHRQTLFRQFVKARLFKKNLDVLAELPRTERVEKLQETFDGQIEDYRRLLDGLKINDTSKKSLFSNRKVASFGKTDDDMMDKAMTKKARIA